ncbi:uncharacterized protein V1518DRAFT_416949 [Limtongia smithiae]|uniref:uncharacterized protein n=1 Tax=Limtongia smithiae TaxID=1125753 RepID=UPI0034CFF720
MRRCGKHIWWWWCLFVACATASEPGAHTRPWQLRRKRAHSKRGSTQHVWRVSSAADTAEREPCHGVGLCLGQQLVRAVTTTTR